MAFLFRACNNGGSKTGSLEDDEGALPVSTYYHGHDKAAMRTTKRQWCFRNPCLATRSRPRGRSVAPVEMTAADINNGDGGGGHRVQEKRSLPSRSPSRKLTPYPGKTGASSLKNLQRLMAPGSQVMSAGDRQTSFNRSNAKKYSLTNVQESKASSICANSGAKPISEHNRRGRGRSNSNSNSNGESGSGSNSKSRESRSSGTNTNGSGSNESGDTGTSSNTYSTCSYDSIDWSKPPSSLLEASMRRVAINEKREMENREKERIKKLKLYPKPLKIFTESFFRGLLSGNGQWASDPRLVNCFNEDARMMTHDGQMYYGRSGLIKRLNRGMERLLKMLGEHNKKKKEQTDKLDLQKLQEMGLECLEPVQVEEGVWRVVFNMKKGVLKYSFEDEFVMENNCIKKLTRRLIR